MRSELRASIEEFVEDALCVLWTIGALVEAAQERVWQRHIALLLDGLRSGPPRRLLVAPIERGEWDQLVHSLHADREAQRRLDVGSDDEARAAAS